jgi:hypothetical protein
MIGVAGEWVWNPGTHCEAEKMTYYSVQVIEMEASWESCEFRADGMEGGGGGGGRGMMAGVGGGSLPPRKRLLARLRQNSWRSSSPLLVSSPGVEEGVFSQGFGQEVVGLDDDEEGGMVAAVGAAVGAEQEEEEEACTGCDVVESSSSSGGMRRIKRGTVYLRFC